MACLAARLGRRRDDGLVTYCADGAVVYKMVVSTLGVETSADKIGGAASGKGISSPDTFCDGGCGGGVWGADECARDVRGRPHRR